MLSARRWIAYARVVAPRKLQRLGGHGYAARSLCRTVMNPMNPDIFDHPDVPPGFVVVADMGRDGLAQFLLDGRHAFSADELVESGGADKGPNPYELLLMSLGACTSMTLRLFARRRSWPLERTVVRLRHSRIHATDCDRCEDKKSLLDHIDVEVELIGALTDQQRAQLKSIAEKCPVHRTLSSPISISTTLVTHAVGTAEEG